MIRGSRVTEDLISSNFEIQVMPAKAAKRMADGRIMEAQPGGGAKL